MAKVRVPKELRPPSRFNAFPGPRIGVTGSFKVIGVYRYPNIGEYFWSSCGMVELAPISFRFSKRVILERVK